MSEDDIDYFRRRQQQELRAADRAADRCCRNIHLQLARRYEMRVAEASAGHGKDAEAETPRRRLSISVGKFSQRSRTTDGTGQEHL